MFIDIKGGAGLFVLKSYKTERLKMPNLKEWNTKPIRKKYFIERIKILNQIIELERQQKFSFY